MPFETDYKQVLGKKEYHSFFFKNGPTPASIPFIFGLFKQTSIQFLQQINVKKYQFHLVNGGGIWTHDLSILNHLP